MTKPARFAGLLFDTSLHKDDTYTPVLLYSVTSLPLTRVPVSALLPQAVEEYLRRNHIINLSLPPFPSPPDIS